MIEENFYDYDFNLLIYDILYSDKDFSSENCIEKITVNEENYSRLFEDLKNKKEIKLLALYGERIELGILCSRILNINVEFTKIKDYPVIMWCLLYENICLFVLSCDSEIFEKKPLNKENILVTMQRYLQDLSPSIIVVPSENLIKKWTICNKTPFDISTNNKELKININKNNKLIIDDKPLQTKTHLNYNDKNIDIILNNNYSQKFFVVKRNENRNDSFNNNLNKFKMEILDTFIRFKKINIDSLLNKISYEYNIKLNNQDLDKIIKYYNETLECRNKILEEFLDKFLYDDIKCMLNSLGSKKKFYIFNLGLHNSSNLRNIMYNTILKNLEKIIFIKNGILVVFDNLKKSIYTIYYNIVNEICENENIDFKTLKIKFEELFNSRCDDTFMKFKIELSKPIIEKLNQFEKSIENTIINTETNFRTIEVFPQIINIIRSDKDAEQYINIINDNSKKITFQVDEILLNMKISKDKIIQLNVTNVFPSENNNYIVIIQSNGDKNMFTIYYGQYSMKVLFKFYINNVHFHYSFEESILYIFDYDKHSLFKYKISNGRYDNQGEINIRNLSLIKEMIYIKNLSKFIFLNIKYELFNLSISDRSAETSKLYKTIIKGNSNSQEEMKPIRDKHYSSIIYSGNGNYYGLISKTVIDFYDIYNIYQLCIEIKDVIYGKIIFDNLNSYLITIDQNFKFKTYFLPKCGSNFEFIEKDEIEKQIELGNPILDYIYSGFIKYGKSIEFLNNYNKNYYTLYNPYIVSNNKHIIDYSKILFEETSISLNVTDSVDEIFNILDKNVIINEAVNKLNRILYSRVPIQLCTIENNNIIPLIDGKRINLSENFYKFKKIEEKARLLSFGYIENLIRDIKEPVFLCCIVGRQSSGKSYLMNRIFGTRFDVRSTRCTDGIWISYSCIENNHLIVFDCEGLFSRQRDENQEVKLITFLAAICDYTYLNQDLSFNRYLNDLLLRLSDSVGRISGSNVFKGKLIWTVRDVSSSALDGAFTEFKGHLESFQKEGVKFLNVLFDGDVTFTCLNNYEHLHFKKEVDDCRTDVLKEISRRKDMKNFHWKNGEELLNSMKLILIQLYTDDTQNLDNLNEEFVINIQTENLNKIWKDMNQYEGKKFTKFEYKIKNENLIIDLKNFTPDYDENENRFTYKSILDKYKNLINNHYVYRMDFINNKLEENKKNDKKSKKNIEILQNEINTLNEVNYNKKNHNDFYSYYNNFLILFSEQRKSIFSEIMDECFNNISLSSDKKKNILIYFKNYINDSLNFEVCLNDCSKCNLLCVNFKNHKKSKNDRLSIIKLELEKLKNHNISDIKECMKKKDELELYLNKLKREYEGLELDYTRLDILQNYILEKDEIKIKDKNMLCQINDLENNIKDHPLVKEKNPVFSFLYNELCKINEDIIYINGISETKYNKRTISINENIIDILRKYRNDYFNYSIEVKEEISEVNDFFLIIPDDYSYNSLNLSIDSIIQDHQNNIYQLEEKRKNLFDKNIDHINIIARQREICNLYSISNKERELELENRKLADEKNKIEEYSSELKKFESSNINKIISYSVCEIINLYKEYKNIIDNINDQKSYLSKYENFDLLEIKYKNLKNEIEKRRSIKFNSNENYLDLLNLISNKKNIYEFEERNHNILNEIILLEENLKICTQELNNVLEIEEFKMFEEIKYCESAILEINKINSHLTNLINREMLLSNIFKELNCEEIKEYLDYSLFLDNIHETEIFDYINQHLNKQIEILKNNKYKVYEELKSIYEDSCIKIKSYQMNIDRIEKELSAGRIFIEKHLNIIKDNENLLNHNNNLLNNFDNEILNHKKIISDLIDKKNNDMVINSKVNLENKEKLKTNEIIFNKIKELIEFIDSILNIKIPMYHKHENEYNEKLNYLSILKNEYDKFKMNEYENFQTKHKEYLEYKGNPIIDIDIITNKIKQVKNKIKNTEIDIKESADIINSKTLKEKLLKEKSQIEKENSLSCDCGTDHTCDEMCYSCLNIRCKNKAGHTGHHLCEKKKHECREPCEVMDCENNCSREYNHKGDHKCDDLHYCKASCEICDQTCSLKITENHSIHKCREKKCKKSCILCNSECSDSNHFHDKEAKDIRLLINDRLINKKLHLCSKEHNCSEKCKNEGVCLITYEEEIKTMIDASGTVINFQYLKPLIDSRDCSIIIQNGKYNHKLKHNCNNKHRCPEKCPECGSICNLEYNHDESNFHDFTHRNKEYCFFTNSTGEDIIINDKLGIRRYKVKDNAIIENCVESCKRRGRGHIHLIKCQGGLTCKADKDKFIIHSEKVYVGYEDYNFDEFNCKEYWNFYKIRHPLDNSGGYTNIDGCNAYCPYCCDESKKYYNFCNHIIGHTRSINIDDHNFTCNCKDDIITYKGLDICFIIDSTGSMGPYIEKSIIAIKTIILQSETYMEKLKTDINTLKIGVVSYKDHSDSKILKTQNFTNSETAISFLNSLEPNGGDDFPEAVADGLDEALKIGWREGTEKIAILVLDAPPHGKQFWSGNDDYPDGCPCKINILSLLVEYEKRNIRLFVMKLNNYLDMMEIEFTKVNRKIKFISPEECRIDFVEQISNIVVRLLADKEITVSELK